MSRFLVFGGGFGRGTGHIAYADVAELVDAPDLGSGGVTRGGSSPFIRTTPPAT